MNITIQLSKYDFSGKITVDGVTQRYSYSRSTSKTTVENVRTIGMSNKEAEVFIKRAREDHINPILEAIKEFGYGSDGHMKSIKESEHCFNYTK